MYTPFAHAFAYAIKQAPYPFVAKIILCMYLLYGNTDVFTFSTYNLITDGIYKKFQPPYF